MSSVEQNSPKEMQSQGNSDAASKAKVSHEGLKSPPERPTLVAPPPRPMRPAQPKPPKPTPVASVTAPSPPSDQTPVVANGHDQATLEIDSPAQRYLPIAPPSEPMQYRAIGLVRGIYQPAETDQLNRGNLTTDEGCVIDAVLLGRITSLVKKHIDLERSHLWVVYPRTRREMETEEDQDLHLQIVGVWEPETLGLPGEVPHRAEGTADATEAEEPIAEAEQPVAELPGVDDLPAADPAPLPLPVDLPPVDENFFSIRGEVVKHSPEEHQIMVKILQGVKRSPGTAKSFKLMLQGDIEGRTVGYFWDFQVKREAKVLVLQSASMVGIVPPKKRPKGGSRRGPGGRRPGGNRPALPNRRPSSAQGSPRPKRPSVDTEQAN